MSPSSNVPVSALVKSSFPLPQPLARTSRQRPPLVGVGRGRPDAAAIAGVKAMRASCHPQSHLMVRNRRRHERQMVMLFPRRPDRHCRSSQGQGMPQQINPEARQTLQHVDGMARPARAGVAAIACRKIWRKARWATPPRTPIQRSWGGEYGSGPGGGQPIVPVVDRHERNAPATMGLRHPLEEHSRLAAEQNVAHRLVMRAA